MDLEPLLHYSKTAGESSAVVIRSYSTSFGLACRLLGSAERRDIENIYALVRIADEVVDGAAAEAGLNPHQVLEQLDALERETQRALLLGYSTNLVVHAFAGTARRAGIGEGLTKPFFASMRTDLTTADHSVDTLAEYIYGSAEVVGLMCLKVFQSMPGAQPVDEDRIVGAARSLGAAFQKVNFLRDLGADSSDLGRHYFPGVDPAALSEAEKGQLLAEIRTDLAVAKDGIQFLAPGAGRAVSLAYELFLALVERIERTPAASLASQRVRVPQHQKALIAARVLATRYPKICQDDGGGPGSAGRPPKKEQAPAPTPQGAP